MRSEATGPGVQHEGFDVDEKISLFDFAGFSLATCNITSFSTIQSVDFLTLMGSSSLNIDGISKRVVYSESVSKMPQLGIEKSNFSDG